MGPLYLDPTMKSFNNFYFFAGMLLTHKIVYYDFKKGFWAFPLSHILGIALPFNWAWPFTSWLLPVLLVTIMGVGGISAFLSYVYVTTYVKPGFVNFRLV